MRFPKKIKYRNKTLATIYGRSKSYPLYRVAWWANGHRQLKAFPSYAEAKAGADKLVRELAKGSLAPALTPGQANDALAALGRLQDFFVSTGQRISLLGAVSSYCDAAGKLRGHVLGEAVNSFLANHAAVQRKEIAQAVEEFITGEAPRTKAEEGQRAQVSPKYAYNRQIHLRRFASTFPNTALCDLRKEHLDAFIGSLQELAAKTRNHARATVRQLIGWAVRKDYLPPDHRLLEADAMRPERANTAEIGFYTANEFRALLEAAEGSMQAMVAIGGLAGLRTAELLRLDWADVWRVPGYIEISARKAKTRQRRLVEIVTALAAWLEPFRAFTSGKICTLHEIIFQQHFLALCEKIGVERKPNGLRHSFVTYHFAAYGNENLTAALAGHSPAMVHQHYKGLATRAEAEKWFNVMPAREANIIPLAPPTTGMENHG